MNSSETDSLTDAVARYQLELDASQIERLEHYCHLLWDWNRKLNLTRHTDFARFAARDLVDCVQLANLLDAQESVLDVGSGGGVPGVVLAVLRPDLRVALCESVGKKAAALRSIVDDLGLAAPVHHARAEQVLETKPFDVLVSRAVGPLWKMLTWFEPHWDAIGRLLAVKGPRWVDERGEARHRGLLKTLDLRKAASYPMPGAYGESVILRISKKV